jgi:hypothetical protein
VNALFVFQTGGCYEDSGVVPKAIKIQLMRDAIATAQK